jgi:hypothetical protein
MRISSRYFVGPLWLFTVMVRDPKGKVMVLHRTRDGKMELIEAP